MGGKNPRASPGHMRQNAYYRNLNVLKWTFKIYFCVFVTQ